VIVEAVKETSFLVGVDGEVGRVQIQHDLFGRFPVCFQKHVDQQSIRRLGVTVDFLISVGFFVDSSSRFSVLLPANADSVSLFPSITASSGS